MDSIETIPTDVLMVELLNRFDHCAIIGIRVGIKPGQNLTMRRWKGNGQMVAGLCADISLVVLMDYKDDEEPGGSE